MDKRVKRPVLLLEVLIAFALVALCIFPLMAPHVFILKAQYRFSSRIVQDQTASRVYARLLEKAYSNEIPWEVFEQKQEHPIEDDLLAAKGLKGTYQFSIARHKGKEGDPFTANVITATLLLYPEDLPASAADEEKKADEGRYEYQFFAARLQEQQSKSDEEDTTSSNTP